MQNSLTQYNKQQYKPTRHFSKESSTNQCCKMQFSSKTIQTSLTRYNGVAQTSSMKTLENKLKIIAFFDWLYHCFIKINRNRTKTAPQYLKQLQSRFRVVFLQRFLALVYVISFYTHVRCCSIFFIEYHKLVQHNTVERSTNLFNTVHQIVLQTCSTSYSRE